ncbi:hypothetical protein X798_02345, partial [Onchocerca flexuosa]
MMMMVLLSPYFVFTHQSLSLKKDSLRIKFCSVFQHLRQWMRNIKQNIKIN